MFSPLIDQLVEAFCCLPGVGPKSAQRMVLQLLERDREGGRRLAKSLSQAMEGVGQCRKCRTLCETEICTLCASPKRSTSGQICVLETPGDVWAVEQTASFNGLYFVLMGHLSPIDGIGPADIGLDLLLNRVQSESIKEVILATNPTVEGEATAYYIMEQLKELPVRVSRIAHGVPLGGELEYVDGGTLAHAISDRKTLGNP